MVTLKGAISSFHSDFRSAFLLFLIILFLSFESCKSPTAPKSNNPPDTTSSNFTFQTFTFGNTSAGSSYLNDVAIISDTDIWAVGAIYLTDSTGQPDPFPYNAVHWDGKSWNLLKVPYYYQGKAFYSPIYSIYAFDASDIWFEAGIHWDGYQFETVPLNIDFPSHVNKIWGTSSNDLYIVGNSGLMAHRNTDGTWQKIESGTNTAFTDIWGSGNTILATVTNEYETGDKMLLQINTNGTVDSLNWSPNSRLQTVWFQSMDKIFIGGGKNIVGKPNNWQEITDIPAYYSERVRGNAPNDVFFVGAFGLCAHYNGSSWKTFNELYNPDESLLGLAVNGNLMIAVGQAGNKAIIIRGYR